MTRSHKLILKDFLRGLTCIGIARKYGMTNLQVQAVIRRALG